MRAFDRRSPRGARDLQPHAAVRKLLDTLDPRAFQDADAFGPECLEHDLGELGVIPPHRLHGFDDDDLAAEASVRLRELEPDRSAAEHQQAIELAAVLEDRLVGEVADLVEAGDGRHCGRGACRHDEIARLNLVVGDRDRVLAREFCRALDDADAKPRHALDGVVGCDRLDDAGDVIGDGRVVDARLHRLDAERVAGAHGVRVLAGGDQGFGRHAADVEAVAAHPRPLDENDLDAELRRADGGDEPARSGADHADIGFEIFGHASLLNWGREPLRAMPPMSTGGSAAAQALQYDGDQRHDAEGSEGQQQFAADEFGQIDVELADELLASGDLGLARFIRRPLLGE